MQKKLKGIIYFSIIILIAAYLKVALALIFRELGWAYLIIAIIIIIIIAVYFSIKELRKTKEKETKQMEKFDNFFKKSNIKVKIYPKGSKITAKRKSVKNK